MTKTTLCVCAAALAALVLPEAASAACRSGPPPGRYSQNDDEGMTLDLSPITRNPLFGAVGGAIAEITQGVTNIRQIVNLTECPVTIRKVDGGSTERKDVEPGGTLETNFWVPWADDAQTYADHHMIISVDGLDSFWLWQDSHVIRFRAAHGYVPRGQNVPGVPYGGGDRTLVVAMSGDKPVFQIIRR